MPRTVGEVVAAHVVHVAADDAVDVGGVEPGVGERRQRRLGGQGQLAAPRVPGEVGGADADDGAAVAVACGPRRS